MTKYYSINYIEKEKGMELLRDVFPTGKANQLNFVLFSTSGVHGLYTTLEEAEDLLNNGFKEEDIEDAKECGETLTNDVTFIVIKPRIVQVIYGNVIIKTQGDLDFLKKLRKTSTEAVIGINGEGYNGGL